MTFPCSPRPNSQAGPDNSPDPGVASFLLANPYFQPDPAKAQLAIIDPTKINNVAKNYIAAGLIPSSSSGVQNPQQKLTLSSNELTGKFDFDIDSKNKLSVTLGWDETHEVTPFDYADVSGFPDVSDFHDYVLNAVYTHIFTLHKIWELASPPICPTGLRIWLSIPAC
jgi:hypothetical protein